jgi:hypothetical protein
VTADWVDYPLFESRFGSDSIATTHAGPNHQIIEKLKHLVNDVCGAPIGRVRHQVGMVEGIGETFLLGIPDIFAPAGIVPAQSDRLEVRLQRDHNLRIMAPP